MPEDIIDGLDNKNLNEFKKDFIELLRVNSGINKEYSKLSKYIDKYTPPFEEVINLFNKKYKNLVIRLKQTTEELKLRIFIKDKSVRDVFINVASRLNGLKSIGINDFGVAPIEETDKFSKELDKVKNKLFISYYEGENGSNAISLEQYKNGLVELHYGDGILNERSQEFKLCAYYAVKDGVKRIDIYERLVAIGFLEKPFLDKVRMFLKKFNPRLEE